MAVKSAPQTLIDESSAPGATIPQYQANGRNVVQEVVVPGLAKPEGTEILSDLIAWINSRVDENSKAGLRSSRTPADRESIVLGWARNYAADRTWVKSGVSTTTRSEFINGNRNMVLNGVYAALL